MASTRELVVKLTADTGQFAKAMQAQTASINKFASMAKTAGIAMLGFMGVQQVGAFAKEVMGATGAAADLARDIGASVEQVDALTWAAKLAGLEASNLHGMMTKLSVATQKFAQGGESKAFEALGLDKAATAGKSAYDMLRMIGERAKGLSGINVTGVFSELFGKGTALRMWDFFENLEQTEKKVREVYDALGLSNESTLNVEALDDSFVELKTTLGLITRVLLNEVGPAIIKTVESISKFVVKVSGGYRDYLTVIKDAAEKAKAEGKGFFGVLGAQLAVIKEINSSAEKTYANVADGIRASKEEAKDLFDLFADLGNQIMAGLPANFDQLGEDADKLTESLKTAAEKYADSMAALDQMKGLDFVSDETYARAVEKYREELEKATPELQELKKVIEGNIDPLRKFAEEMYKLEGWHGLGFLDSGTYKSALEKLKTETAGALNITALIDADDSGMNKFFEDAKKLADSFKGGLIDESQYTQALQRLNKEMRDNDPLVQAAASWEEQLKEMQEQMAAANEERLQGSAATASSLSEIIGKGSEGRQDYAREAWTEQKKTNQLLEQLVANMRAYVPVYG